MRRYGENNRMGIEGRVAVVTGAASGIGRGAAMVFAREGAKVSPGRRWQLTAESAPPAT